MTDDTAAAGIAIEFYFDLGSPAAYLAHARLHRVASATGAGIIWRPVLLGGLFKATGNTSPLAVPAKREHFLRDMERWAQRYSLPLRFPEHFPIDSLRLMRTALVAREEGVLEPFVRAAFVRLWAEGLDLGDPREIEATAAASGLDPTGLQRRVEAPEAKAALRAETEAAAARGVFGVPTFVVAGELFFGQDRLDFAAEALVQQRGGPIRADR